jgi:hypothetical protein
MSARNRLSCLAFLLALPGLAPAAAPPSRDVLERFDFDPEAGCIIVPVRLKGKVYPFMVDTGCTISAFDKSLQPLLGDEIGYRTGMSPGGPTPILLVKAPIAYVGRRRLPREQPVIVHDLFRKLREEHGLNVWGCIGMDFLADYPIRVDFDRGRVSILRSTDGTAGHRLRLRMAKDVCPEVQVHTETGTQPLWFTIDTGCNDCGTLDNATYHTLYADRKLVRVGWSGSLTAAGNHTSEMGRINWLKIGPFEHADLHLARGRDNKRRVLGLGVWSRYQVTFDFPNKAVYLRKGRRHQVADLQDGSGLSILLRKGQAIVEAVAGRSPAAEADICERDVVVSIAGRKAAGANLLALRKLLHGEGRTVRLVLRRGEKTREVQLRLAVAWRTDKANR